MTTPTPALRDLVRLLALFFAGVAVAFAQTGRTPDRVTFYTEPNFRGESLTVEAGAHLETLDRVMRTTQRPWTFAISSVRVEGAARATVYAAPGFRGDRLEITASIADLYGTPRGQEPGASWDRAIASVAVTGPSVARPATRPPFRTDTAPQVVHVVPAPVPAPSPANRPPPPRYDARTAERMVRDAYREVLARDVDPSGLRHYRQRLLREGWSERQLIVDLQRSEEARAIDPVAAITRAYQEELGREPDPGGLNHYRGKWREGWTQGQIRADLQQSAEGRQVFVRNAITRAYRELLGRDPDPAGYAAYEQFMREQGGTERDMRAAIMAGEEYRQRRGRR